MFLLRRQLNGSRFPTQRIGLNLVFVTLKTQFVLLLTWLAGAQAVFWPPIFLHYTGDPGGSWARQIPGCSDVHGYLPDMRGGGLWAPCQTVATIMECSRRTTFINIQMRRSGLCLRGNGGSVAVQESEEVHQQFRGITADEPLWAFKPLAESLSDLNHRGVFDMFSDIPSRLKTENMLSVAGKGSVCCSPPPPDPANSPQISTRASQHGSEALAGKH